MNLTSNMMHASNKNIIICPHLDKTPLEIYFIIQCHQLISVSAELKGFRGQRSWTAQKHTSLM